MQKIACGVGLLFELFSPRQRWELEKNCWFFAWVVSSTVEVKIENQRFSITKWVVSEI
jgi:hypothetical protein